VSGNFPGPGQKFSRPGCAKSFGARGGEICANLEKILVAEGVKLKRSSLGLDCQNDGPEWCRICAKSENFVHTWLNPEISGARSVRTF
jgi:hypothetical protein